LNALQALFLGIVQGLTEFLPVSSSGHLVLSESLLGVETPGVLVEVALHVATLLAVCWAYRGRLAELVRGVLGGDRPSLVFVGLLALASVPAGVIGFTLMDVLEPVFDRPVLAAACLLVTGVIVWTLRSTGPRAAAERPGAVAALAIGAAQAFALLPGISRSGSTVAAGVALGVTPIRAAEFSFLMSVPAIAGAAVAQAPELRAVGSGIGVAPLAIGFVAALVSGVFAIRVFVRMLSRRTFHHFAYYCWAVGTAYLVAAWLVPGLR